MGFDSFKNVSTKSVYKFFNIFKKKKNKTKQDFVLKKQQ